MEQQLGTALVLAIAWGASVGGFLTPLGGAPNLLAMKFVQDTVTHHEFLFVTWLTRLALLTLRRRRLAALYIRRLHSKRRPIASTDSRIYFVKELQALGTMTGRKLGVAFRRRDLSRSRGRFYGASLAGTHAGFSFLAFGLVVFVVRSKGQPLLTWEYTQGKMMWGLFYVFAGGTALGNILSKTGTAKYLAHLLLPYAGSGRLAAIVVFSVLTIAVAQIISNVATVAIRCRLR